ncbi:hypothetical protein ThimaDRAFT_1505 [Thiocapsa marina 5811]|uniref:Uncharacterized protein n=1 Tax=Thiocapsa marina 5811 TaxID=768671 RepID=F9U9A3_9GAMM|nr:hypothetical protein ThimaDRAFT_1505 [Thiocapsa marina 5811]
MLQGVCPIPAERPVSTSAFRFFRLDLGNARDSVHLAAQGIAGLFQIVLVL